MYLYNYIDLPNVRTLNSASGHDAKEAIKMYDEKGTTEKVRCHCR
jgi:hypothetical protein